jgi:hypothetical protein
MIEPIDNEPSSMSSQRPFWARLQTANYQGRARNAPPLATFCRAFGAIRSNFDLVVTTIDNAFVLLRTVAT